LINWFRSVPAGTSTLDTTARTIGPACSNIIVEAVGMPEHPCGRQRRQRQHHEDEPSTLRHVPPVPSLGVYGRRLAKLESLGRSPELLIDCEEDRTLGTVLVGMSREANRGP
jgi:hypothetical protein